MAITSISEAYTNQADEELDYPDGLTNIPQLLNVLEDVEQRVGHIAWELADYASSLEALSEELGRTVAFAQTRRAKNLQRERRRNRRRRNGNTNGNGQNGHAEISPLTAFAAAFGPEVSR